MNRRSTPHRTPICLSWSVLGTLLVVCGFALGLSGCLKTCDQSPRPTAGDPTAPWPRSSKLVGRVPTEATTVLFVRRLGDLKLLTRFVEQTIPADTLHLPEELVNRLDVSKLGLDPNQSAALFYYDGAWRAVTRIDDRKRFEAGLRRLAADMPLEARGEEKRVERLVYRPANPANDAEPKTVARLRHRHGAVFVRLGPAGDDSATDVLPKADRKTWPADPDRRQLLEELASRKARFVGIGDPSSLVPSASSKAARRVRDRLAHQLGPTGIRASFTEEPANLSVDIHIRPAPGEPVVVSTLGTARGEIPSLGGLVEPGVLGVGRLSVDPQATYRLLRSTLPASQRRKLDSFWQQLRKKLLIDGPDEVLDNFTGHAFVVFYGLAGDSLAEGSGSHWRRLLGLQTTREVVMLPITSRENLERLLDKATQLSRGRLSRQTGDHNVQYAWFEDGRLAWAMILSDEHLLFVDSPTSFDKALAFERRGGSLSDETRDTMRIGPLLEQTGRSGLYLDAGTISGLLAEKGLKGVSEWLAPFDKILLTTEMDGSASRTQIRLEFNDE